jgi:predicted transcriptional regulator
MSPRAASRLETLGVTRVYDYAAGKADWGSYGLPLDGHADSSTRVSGIAATDVPTCRLDELVADVTAQLRDDWDICVVTNDANIVLGLLGRSALRSNQKTSVEDAMTPGPSTIRPSARLEAITKRMDDQNLTRIIVTRSDGVLFGVRRAEDIEPPSIGR